MYLFIRTLHVRLKNRVLDLAYAHGLFVADHSLYIILICFGIFLLSLFQITTHVPPPGSSLEIFTESARSFRPVRARLELNISDELHDKQPDKPLWYSGYPLAYVQHIVVRCSSLTSRLSCLLRARDIRDRLFTDPDFDTNCLRVGEPINTLQSYLPSFGCLILSPLNLWSNDISHLPNDERDLFESIPSVSKRLIDIIFGIPQSHLFSSSSSSSSHSTMNYALTVMLINASSEYRQQLKIRLLNIDKQSENEIVHIYFSRKSLLYYMPLIVLYIVVFLYIYYSVSQFECVKSKWGLAMAAIVQIFVSLLISLALSSFFHMTPRLNGGEAFPYLVIFIGLENLVVITRAVTSSQAQKQYDDIRERVAHALRAESWTIAKHLFYELLIVTIGFITYVPTVREFCQFALIGILIDFFMQINFWLAVLSIDIRRITVSVRSKNKMKNSDFGEEKREPQVLLPMRMPPSTGRRYQQPQQQQPQSQWARYRILQRGSMFLVLIWFILIFYKSCLIVDLLHKNVQINREQIKGFVSEKTLNEHYGSTLQQQQQDSPHILHEPVTSNISMGNFEWQTLLSFDHWPTLFSYYNISHDNRYLTIMPSIYMPVIHPGGGQDRHLPRRDQQTKSSPRSLLNSSSTSSSLIDRRFSTALWELLFIVLFGMTLFSVVYFCFLPSTSSSSFPIRFPSYIKSDYAIVPTILPPPLSSSLIESICLHESGTNLSVAYSDGSLCMWNPQTGGILFNQQRYQEKKPISNHVWCLLMLDEYTCLCGCSDGQLELYPTNLSSKKKIILTPENTGGITHLVRASSTLIIGATRRGYLMAFEYINGMLEELYVKRLHQWPIRVCQIDSNSRFIFTGSDDYSIKVTNISNGSCLHTLHKHQAPVNCLALDPYHPISLISGCFNGTLCLWNGDCLQLTNLNAHPSSIIVDIRYCNHSSTIISLGSDKRLCLWTSRSLQLIHELHDITSNCFALYHSHYLFYIHLNHLYLEDTIHQTTKMKTLQLSLPYEQITTIHNLIYTSPTETLIIQDSDMIYAMHLPQRIFLATR